MQGTSLTLVQQQPEFQPEAFEHAAKRARLEAEIAERQRALEGLGR